MSQAILQTFFDGSIRAEKIINVAMSCAHWGDSLPDDFEEAFFDEFLAGSDPSDHNVAPLIECLPDIGELIGREDFDEMEADHVAEWFVDRGYLGFLAKIATPVCSFHPGGGSWSSSWGYSYTTWIYAATLEGLAERASSWAEAMINADRAKVAAGSGGEG